MKQNFDQCLEWLLVHEGGFVNHPKDPGGMTNLGVTKATLERWTGSHVTEEDMRALEPANVAPIYKGLYWDKVNGDNLPSGVDWAMFDWAVNSGPRRPIKALQRAVGASQDGILGPKTLRSVADTSAEHIINSLHDQRQRFYEGLSTFSTFGRGWTHRNKETKTQALSLYATA